MQKMGAFIVIILMVSVAAVGLMSLIKRIRESYRDQDKQ